MPERAPAWPIRFPSQVSKTFNTPKPGFPCLHFVTWCPLNLFFSVPAQGRSSLLVMLPVSTIAFECQQPCAVSSSLSLPGAPFSVGFAADQFLLLGGDAFMCLGLWWMPALGMVGSDTCLYFQVTSVM